MRAPEDLRLLQIAAFTSAFDRLMIAPLLIVIAADLDLDVPAVAGAATANLVAYGLMQMVWALVSDRFGRVRTMRSSLLLAALASFAAAGSVGIESLIAARALAGAAFAAAVPGALIYIGDTVPAARRQGPLSDLMRGTAVGSAAATAGAGLIGGFVDWRAAFFTVGVVALVLAYRMGRLPEPPTTRAQGILRSLRVVLAHRWALLVLLLAGGEGLVLLAVLNFLPAAVVDADGVNAALAGALVGGYGLAVLLATPVVKRVAAQARPHRLVAAGGGLANLGLMAFVLDQGVMGILCGSSLLGAGWAFMHSTLQTWITEVVPGARAAAVSLFATALFTGSAAGTYLGSRLLADADYRMLFVVAVLAGVPLVALASAGRARYSARS